jgi:hypothetical protein
VVDDESVCRVRDVLEPIVYDFHTIDDVDFPSAKLAVWMALVHWLKPGFS